MTEPEVALAFTPDPWVEELHRHLSDHGGARVRSVVIEPGVAVEEAYDVLVAGHRWHALTQALVGDVQGLGRSVLGVFDREEPSSREHLVALGVDAVVESDAGADRFVRAIADVAGARRSVPLPPSHLDGPGRRVRLVTVGGPPGSGRTEVALQLSLALARSARVVLVDADDVAPAVAQRWHLPIEPNVATAIDAVEHGRGELGACVVAGPAARVGVVPGVPNPGAWAQVRPGEVLRVIDGLSASADVAVADGVGLLDDLPAAGGRGRYATARALVVEAGVLVGVADASPHGVVRFLSWAADARRLARTAPLVVVANRAPGSRYRRGELYEEITATLPVAEVVFAPHDPRVADASWDGAPVARGPFTRAVERVAATVSAL